MLELFLAFVLVSFNFVSAKNDHYKKCIDEKTESKFCKEIIESVERNK